MKKQLLLQEKIYPGETIAEWTIPFSEVNEAIAEGKVPYIVLPTHQEDKSKPTIAVILGKNTDEDTGQEYYSVFPDYVTAIIQAGGNPVFIGYDKIREQLRQAKPQGILLIGGCFVSPAAWYEEAQDEDTDHRGQAYLEIIKYAKSHKIATLGICGGHQMIAGSEGAMMMKGINANLEKDHSHKQPAYQIAHEVNVEPDSLLYKIIKKEKILTNSAHSEALIGNKMGHTVITARAKDGIIEAMELKKPWHPFVIGVQWHPERLAKLGDETSLKIFKAFVEAAGQKDEDND